VMQGQTVYYRLTDQDAIDIEISRRAVAPALYDGDNMVTIPPRHVFHGAPVEADGMLPAEIVTVYSEFDAKSGFKCDKVPFSEPDKRSHRLFSGVADIRVKLPGNDVLWVPRAQWDPNPVIAKYSESYGVGNYVIPKPGLFTVVQPPSLLT
jgi:hypothetical protein